MENNYNPQRLCRKLRLFHIFTFCETIELIEITSRIEYKRLKTIQRDITDLMEAGVIDVYFSKEHRGYRHKNEYNYHIYKPPIVTDNKAKNQHLQKLNRLCFLMCLYYDDDLPYWEEKPEGYKTVSDLYKDEFPECSKRTMQRDFEILCEIGYIIRYDNFEKRYVVDFPMDLYDNYLDKDKW